MKPQNIIIAAFFLLVVSFFSFSFEKITGNPIKITVPEMTIINEEVKAGQPIQIRVKINDFCVDPEITFYAKNGLKKDTRLFKPTRDDCASGRISCAGGKYCKGNLKNDYLVFDYYTLPSWRARPGFYTARIHYIEKVGQRDDLTPYIERRFKVS